jgi:hypothetical protein
MNRNEYERIRARLEEQRRSGIAMVEAAYKAQIRSVDLVWRLQGEEGDSGFDGLIPEAPAKQRQDQPIAPAGKRSAPQVDEDVRAVLPRLPESFTRHDVCKALGYEPYRGALYRSLQKLVAEGHTRLRTQGEGHRAAVYEKTDGEDTGTSA